MEVVRGVHRVEGVRWSNVYLIEDEVLALVDTGPPGSVGRVAHLIKSLGRRPEELRYILLTHSHPDHTGSVAAIRELTGAQVLAHGHDTRRHGAGAASASYMGLFGSLPLPIPFLKRAPVDIMAEDEHRLPGLGGLKVIHTPGHTPGSLCFLLEDKGVLFTGDTLLSNGVRFSGSIPYPGSSMADYHRSLVKLRQLDFQVACGGHGRPLAQGASERLAAFLEDYPACLGWRRPLARETRAGRRQPETGG